MSDLNAVFDYTKPFTAKYLGRTWFAEVWQNKKPLSYHVPVCWRDEMLRIGSGLKVRLWFKTPTDFMTGAPQGKHLAVINDGTIGEDGLRHAGKFVAMYDVVRDVDSLEGRHGAFTMTARVVGRYAIA